MGMFDYVRCDYPLPDGGPPAGAGLFQTKDTPDQFLRVFKITDGGHLEDPKGGRVLFHGALYFYTSGASIADWYEYAALFDHGTLLKLERVPNRAEVTP